MKIAIDGRAASLYRGTGIGTYSYQLINNLNKIDFLNEYMLFTSKNSKFDFNLRENFKTSEAVENKSFNFWEKVRIPNILIDNKVDIYHVPQNGVGLSQKIDCPSVITLHDIIPLKMPETCSDRYLKIFNEELPKILNKCSGIITVSNFSKDDIAKEFNFPKDKIFVTPLASEDIYKPLNKLDCKEILKNEYNISCDYILYVGGFSPRKNIVGLIDAFSILKKEYKKPLKLIILGSHGISYEKYKRRCEELLIESDVLFPGFIPLQHMPVFYNSCKAFVYPSFYEGFGLPPLEAMACGAPVIASSCTSIPEVVGNSALTINPSDVYDIKNAILELLNNYDLSLSLTNKSIDHASKFSWIQTAYSTMESYKAIIDYSK